VLWLKESLDARLSSRLPLRESSVVVIDLRIGVFIVKWLRAPPPSTFSWEKLFFIELVELDVMSRAGGLKIVFGAFVVERGMGV
jgi:hypothetical protein